ncbi:MAG TPA: hypothetical protein ENJ41_08245 [Oceanospirillales bacterium]|nr:hypothetical protein [Oceanospirillales bacterium]
MKYVNKIKYTNLKLLLLVFGLYGCQNKFDEFECEHNIHMTCQNEIKCENGRNINKWHFQKTWFTKPERKKEYFAAVFGNETGIFFHPGIERDGNYCIDDKTIVFRNDDPDSQLERIEILNLSELEMTLKFENGEEITYYNPK